MRISKKNLMLLIENFLYEDNEDKKSKPENLNILMSDDEVIKNIENAFDIDSDIVFKIIFDPNCSLFFNGNKLKWLNGNNDEIYSWDASTSKDFDSKKMYSSQYKNPRETMNISSYGATPEGMYQIGETQIRDESVQAWLTGMWKTFQSGVTGRFGGSRTAWHWNANTQVSKDAWGDFRFPLIPESGTEMFGRSDMYLHGGKSPGSAGCIDTTKHISEIARLIIAWRYWNSLDDKEQKLASGKIVRFPNRTVPLKLEVNYDEWEPLQSEID